MTKKSNDSPALAPQNDCLDCGGLHIGSTYCPFTRCSECGIKTDICCADCKINTGSSVRVCPNCMDKHESRVKCTPALAEPAATSDKKVDLLLKYIAESWGAKCDCIQCQKACLCCEECDICMVRLEGKFEEILLAASAPQEAGRLYDLERQMEFIHKALGGNTAIEPADRIYQLRAERDRYEGLYHDFSLEVERLRAERVAAAPSKGMDIKKWVENLRENCHGTYNGGHHDEIPHDAFHHGMDTVCNVLAGGSLEKLIAGAAPSSVPPPKLAEIYTRMNESVAQIVADNYPRFVREELERLVDFVIARASSPSSATRFDIYPWLNETLKASGWNVGRFIQFAEEHGKLEDLADTILAARSSAGTPEGK